MSQQIYDVALVLGSGIKEDGSIPESARLRTEKALELYHAGTVRHILFSGKWSHAVTYRPPFTEAKAMAEYGLSLGLPENVIILEEDSISTISNFSNCKHILLKNNWNSALFIINRPYQERAVFNMKKVFGPDFICDSTLTSFRFAREKEIALEALEAEKITYAKELFKNVADGDDESLLRIATEDLNKKIM